MAPRQQYTCLLCDTEKWTCRRAAKVLIGETVKEAVELDTDHRSYSAVRERVRALIQANRQIKESDRFCMPCADHHMAGLRRKNVVPEKTVGGVCKCCKKDNAEHVLKAGMCPTCWVKHQLTCLRNEYAEDGVTCEKCRATECGGEAWYKGSEDGTYVCCKCYSEIALEEHRIQGTKCAKCGNSECGGQAWYRGSKDGTYLCKTCYDGARRAKKSGRIYTPRRGTPLTRMTTLCEHCGEEETSQWYSGPRAGTRICHACYCKKWKAEKKRSAPASKSAPRQPSKKRKATAASAGTMHGAVRKFINKTIAAAFSLAGLSTRGGSAAA
jgi:hypothetical protein